METRIQVPERPSRQAQPILCAEVLRGHCVAMRKETRRWRRCQDSGTIMCLSHSMYGWCLRLGPGPTIR